MLDIFVGFEMDDQMKGGADGVSVEIKNIRDLGFPL
jgi:hypothetical protein